MRSLACLFVFKRAGGHRCDARPSWQFSLCCRCAGAAGAPGAGVPGAGAPGVGAPGAAGAPGAPGAAAPLPRPRGVAVAARCLPPVPPGKAPGGCGQLATGSAGMFPALPRPAWSCSSCLTTHSWAPRSWKVSLPTAGNGDYRRGPFQPKAFCEATHISAF